MKIRHILLTLCLAVTPFANVTIENPTGQDKQIAQDKQMVIELLRSCKYSLYKILNHASMQVYDHELKQLLNNSRIHEVNILGFRDLQDYREQLLNDLSNLQINEEEKRLLDRVNSMEKDAMKWNALSNALNPTMLLTGGPIGPQALFTVGITAARSIVEYNALSNEHDIKELKERFALRKKNMETFKNLRVATLKLEHLTYDKYSKELGISEFDRQVEDDIEAFDKIITKADPYERIIALETEYNKKMFGRFFEYDYHLGMAYLDNGDTIIARKHLRNYLNKALKTPLYRTDEMLATAALALLPLQMTLDDLKLIDIIKSNLPKSGAALIQCAGAYFALAQKYPQYEKEGLLTLIDLISETGINDNKELAFLLLINRMNSLQKFDLEDRFYRLLKGSKGLNFSTYVNYLWNYKRNKIFDIDDDAPFMRIKVGEYHCASTFGKLLNCPNYYYDISIKLNKNFQFNLDETHFYTEMYNHKKGKLIINQYRFEYGNAYPLEKMKESDAEDFFNNNPEAIYLFVKSVVPDSLYTIDPSITYEQINSGSILKDRYTCSNDDKNNLIDFWNEFKGKKPVLKATFINEENEPQPFIERLNDFSQDSSKRYTFYGRELHYEPYMLKNIFSEKNNERIMMFIKIIVPDIKDISNRSKIILTYAKVKGEDPYLYSVEDEKEIYILNRNKTISK